MPRKEGTRFRVTFSSAAEKKEAQEMAKARGYKSLNAYLQALHDQELLKKGNGSDTFK